MDLRLKPELQKFIDDQVQSGEFASADDVVEAGLARLMLDPLPDELDEETIQAIRRANAEFDRGEGRPFDEVAAALRRKHLNRE